MTTAGQRQTFCLRPSFRGGLRVASPGRLGRPLRQMVPLGSWLRDMD